MRTSILYYVLIMLTIFYFQSINSAKNKFENFETKRSPYRVLGIPSYSNWKQIKIQYKHLTIKYHPDKLRAANPAEHEINKKRFMEINEAYEKLKQQRSVSDEDEDDNQFSTILFESFCTILVIIIYAKLQEYVLKFLVWMVEKLTGFFVMYFSFYHIVERYFDHYFDEETQKQGCILLLSGAGLIFKNYYFKSNNTSIKEVNKDS